MIKERKHVSGSLRLFFLGFFVSGTTSGVILSLSMGPSSFFPPIQPRCPLYPQFPSTNSLPELPLFYENLLVPFSSELVRICSFKIKPSEDPEAKPLIAYTPWTKAELQAIVKDFPKVTEVSHRFAEKFNKVLQTY